VKRQKDAYPRSAGRPNALAKKTSRGKSNYAREAISRQLESLERQLRQRKKR
jgi:predicted DNA-binding protein